MINLGDILNSKFWEHLTLSKVIVYMFTAICIVFFFKADTIALMWQNHDQAKYGSVPEAYFIDTLNYTTNFWKDSLSNLEDFYEDSIKSTHRMARERIRDLRHENDSLKKYIDSH